MRHTTMLLAGCALAGALGCGEVKDRAADPDAQIDAGPDAAVAPVERCNGLDDNGDGRADERWTGSFVQGFAGELVGWESVPPSELAHDTADKPIAQSFPRVLKDGASVIAGVLTLTDAATTVSRSTVGTELGGSWIYDLDVDRGNQVFHNASIGGGDFELTVDFTMETSADKAMLAGVALTGSAMVGKTLEHNVIEAFVGAYDPTLRAGTAGTARAWIRQVGNRGNSSLGLSSAETPHASYRVVLSRVRGELTIEAREAAGDDAVDQAAAPVFRKTVAMDRDIERVALVGVRLNTVPFGALHVRELALCWGPRADAAR
jgi:hypothetical protein